MFLVVFVRLQVYIIPIFLIDCFIKTQQKDTNCEILLAKDFGRTGSSISLANGQLRTKLTPKSGFEIVSNENGVIIIKADARLFGNVAGALGTMV